MTDNGLQTLPQPERPPLSRLAILSAVLGIMSAIILPITLVAQAMALHANKHVGDIWFVPYVLSVAAALASIILGSVACLRIAKSGGGLRGEGLAAAGAGASLTLLLLVFGALVAFAIAMSDFPHQT
jgi:hypothetical protein